MPKKQYQISTENKEKRDIIAKFNAYLKQVSHKIECNGGQRELIGDQKLQISGQIWQLWLYYLVDTKDPFGRELIEHSVTKINGLDNFLFLTRSIIFVQMQTMFLSLDGQILWNIWYVIWSINRLKI